MSGIHDFDAAWDDAEDEPVVVRLLGEEWKCKRPSEVPASLLLKMDRMLLIVASDQVPDDFVLDDSMSTESILRQLAGDDNVDSWLARGLPYARLMDVSRHLTARYRGQDPEAPAAPRRERRAAAKKKPSRSRTS